MGVCTTATVGRAPLRGRREGATLGAPMPTVGVMVVDHREPYRRAARELVANTPDFTSLGESASAEEALETAIQVRPDLVLVEAELPGIDGMETSKRLEEALPGSVVVLLAAERDLTLETLTPTGLQALWRENRPA
jgi:DNA-binding NarL/FixJ family response regulator